MRYMQKPTYMDVHCVYWGPYCDYHEKLKMVKCMPIVHQYVVYILEGNIYNGQHSHIKYTCIASIYMPVYVLGFLIKPGPLGIQEAIIKASYLYHIN